MRILSWWIIFFSIIITLPFETSSPNLLHVLLHLLSFISMSPASLLVDGLKPIVKHTCHRYKSGVRADRDRHIRSHATTGVTRSIIIWNDYHVCNLRCAETSKSLFSPSPSLLCPHEPMTRSSGIGVFLLTSIAS